MGNGKIAERLILILLVAALGFAGGTARLRPDARGHVPETPKETMQPKETKPPKATKQPKETAAVPAAKPTPAETAPTPTPTPAPERYVFSFVGDCTLASDLYHQGGPDGYDTVINGDFSYPFAKTVRYFADDDFTMANLECALTKSTNATAKTFVYKTDAEYARIMTEGSVEFVSLANNHVLDYGQAGYADTKAAVEAEGLAYAGRDEWTLYTTERGLVIGVYAVSFGSADQIKAGVAAVKAAGAEFVIAALHFGTEGSYHVNAEQITMAHAAVDAGADFVYGSHSHTLQPVEEYKGVYIYYSMGNWTFGGNTNPRDKDTFILRMTVERAYDGGVTVLEREHIPCACSGEANRNNYQPVPYEKDSEAWKRVLSKLDGTFTGADLSIGYGYTANE